MPEGRVPSFEDIVISYGCWIACIRDIRLDNFHCYHQKELLVSLPPYGLEALLTLGILEVNGRHLSSDVTFIEKRRRGLARFTNALVRHPILSQEQLVIMFLTVPTVIETPHRGLNLSKLIYSSRN